MNVLMTEFVKMAEEMWLRKWSNGLKIEVSQLRKMLEDHPVVQEEEEVPLHNTQFEHIKQLFTLSIDTDFIKSIKTEKGNTQTSERKYIQKIKDIFQSNNISFEEATPQEPYDFRNVGGTGMLLEIKKTNTNTVIFNDTCPSSNVFYVVFVTKEKKERMLFIRGNEFIQDSPWIKQYTNEINALKDKYGRGKNKQKGTMEVYPRPTYRANITKFM